MKRISPSFFMMLGVLAVCIVGTIWASTLFAANEQTSPDSIWHDVQERQINVQGKRLITPDVYRVIAADTKALHKTLAAAPLEGTSVAQEVVLNLPMPDGSWNRFVIVNAPIMEAELAQRFPEIQTYRGYSLDQRGVTARLDWTPAGFHGVIYLANDMIFIDPYSRNDTTHYISYSRAAYMTSERRAEKGMEQVAPVSTGTKPAANRNEPTRIGETLRTYRLAVAATGEYTAFHGGSVAQAQAAIVTTINRVVGVYEKEVAVRLVLINNNQNIIYTDGNTDPYTNDDGGAMLDENQANIDNVIGTANYDVGHVFSTGGGGIAALGSPCNTSIKAMGVTGSFQPVGDPFDIDYVAHELGHQFGANHTYNTESGSCGGNRNPTTAYEPGSGTTIMAYAGICAPDNVQPNSDPYFHYASISEISTFVSGAGDACAVKTTTGNTAPVAEAGPNYTIPANTPFQLTGSGSDVNGDTLTYTWEEYDLGTASPPHEDDGSRPLFRSFSPSSSPVRILPQLGDILNGAATFGETLPTTNRTMTFRLTVRDNNVNGGGIGTDTMNVNVDASKGPFAVVAPNTSVVWPGESQQFITWNVAGTTAAPVSCANVDILVSTNGGATFTALATGTANDGTEQITVPNSPTTTARIKVACSNNIFFDISNENFSISGSGGATATPITTTPTTTAVTSTATPTMTNTPVVGSCPDGQTENILFFDDVETMNNYWTGTNALGITTWSVTNTASYSPDESWYGPNIGVVSDLRLTLNNAIGFSATANSANLSFWHRYDLEEGFDGGVLEYSTDGGNTWQDAGGLMTSNGYNNTLEGGTTNPLQGREVFTGTTNGTFIQTNINLSSLIGQNVLIRFRIGTDSSESDQGWFVDDIRITTCGTGATSTPTATNVTTTPTPTATSVTNTPTATSVTNTPTATSVTNTPTATSVTNTPTPSHVTMTPTPTNTPSTITPTVTSVTTTPTATNVTTTPTVTATPDTTEIYEVYLPIVMK